MSELDTPISSGMTRRDALRRGAILGGAAVWTAPAVQTIGVRAAFGQDAIGTPPPTEPPPGNGTVTGQVSDARTGGPIDGATVQIAGQMQVTGPDGQFSFTNVAAGSQTLQASASGYSTASATVMVVDGATVTHNLELSALGLITAVLTWGANPEDLDLHASGPDGSGGRFHVYFGNGSSSGGNASLDRDDTSSFGPETTTISVLSAPGSGYVPGTYEFWVHHYFGNGDLATSGGELVLTGRESQVGAFLASGASGPADSSHWRVVSFTLDAAGMMSNVTTQQLLENNQFGASGAGVVY